MKIYPYRTTFDKLETALTDVQESGDVVLSTHFLGGRDWVLLCRSGRPTIVDLDADELAAVISSAVCTALEEHRKRAMLVAEPGKVAV